MDSDLEMRIRQPILMHVAYHTVSCHCEATEHVLRCLSVSLSERGGGGDTEHVTAASTSAHAIHAAWLWQQARLKQQYNVPACTTTDGQVR